MTPQAIDNFDDSPPPPPPPRWKTTAIDLVSPFAQEPLGVVGDGQGILAIDAPTTLLQSARFQELPPGTIVGARYEIGARLGAGSMGEVYAARHMALGKHVAIKVIGQHLSEDDRAIGRFIREARILAQIQHPAIVTVEHVGTLPDGRAYFVMEHLRGESLSDRLSRGRIPFREALRILDQMARGLAAAHISGIIHRDLKPDNTFLVHHAGEKPTVKLIDFGLALPRSPNATSNQTAPFVFGTPMYMSPEQVRGFHLNHRSDIYALGCVAYELVLGERPFPQAHSTPAICAAHLHGTPPQPRSIWPGIPPRLGQVLFTMLAKDPAHRPTLGQLRAIVTNLRTSTPSQQTATMLVGPRRPKKTMTRPALTLLAAIGFLAAGAMLGVAFSSTIHARSPNTQPQPLHPTSTLIEPTISAGKAAALRHEQRRGARPTEE